MKHATSVRLDQATLNKLELLKTRYKLSATDVITKLIQDAATGTCDNQGYKVGDEVPGWMQGEARISELRDGVMTYVYPQHLVVARIVRGKLRVSNVFHANVWHVAKQSRQFLEIPVRVLEGVEYAQRNPDNPDGWSRERKLAEGYPV